MRFMQSLLIVLTLFLNACDSGNSKTDHGDQFIIKQGEQKGGFIFTNDKVEKNGKVIHFRHLNPQNEILVSTSTDGSFAVLVNRDIDRGGQELVVIDTETGSEVTSIPNAIAGAIGGTIVWDTENRFAAVNVTGEGTAGIYLIDTERRKGGGIQLRNLTSHPCEIQWVKDDFDFSETGKLKFHIDIDLNPWLDESDASLKCQEGKFYPTYLAIVDLKTLSVNYAKD